MTSAPDEPGSASLQRIIDKGQAARLVEAMFDGSELTIRKLKRDLVISNPADRDKGRIYLEYATGHVSWTRTVSEHWGLLQGYEDEDGNPGRVGANQILTALCGPAREVND
jgi:hypothetical protein